MLLFRYGPRCAQAAIWLTCSLLAGPAAATARGQTALAEQAAASFLSVRPLQNVAEALGEADPYAFQQRYVGALVPVLGPAIGYKVALTSRPAQEMFQAEGPAYGVLLSDMLLDDGDAVPLEAGVRLMYEPDLLAVVGDEAINDARTPLEAARSLVRLIAFIELPDLAVAEGEPMDARTLVALNAGARFGILGESIQVAATPAFLAALENLAVTVYDQRGEALALASGRDLLGHPLQPLLWLVERFRAEGRRLRKGEVVSLGSFIRPEPAISGQEITVVYEGLPGGPLQVAVTFR